MPKEGLLRGHVSFASHEDYRVLLEGGGETAAEPSGTLRAYGEDNPLARVLNVDKNPAYAALGTRRNLGSAFLSN